MFQAGVPDLIRLVMGIFGLQERPRVRLLLRRDPFRRYYSCLVFVPREKYNTQVRQRIERVIGEALEPRAWSRRCRSRNRTSPASTSWRARCRRGLAQRRRCARAADRRRGAFLGGRFQDGAPGALRRSLPLKLFATYAQAFPRLYEDFSAMPRPST